MLFSYSSHKNWTWIETNRKSRKNIFHFFFHFYYFPYCLLYTFLYRPLWTGKNGQKWFFSDFDLFVWEGCSIDITLEMDPFDPKRHPKSLVSISSTYKGKNSNEGKCCLFWYEVRKLNAYIKRLESLETLLVILLQSYDPIEKFWRHNWYKLLF